MHFLYSNIVITTYYLQSLIRKERSKSECLSVMFTSAVYYFKDSFYVVVVVAVVEIFRLSLLIICMSSEFHTIAMQTHTWQIFVGNFLIICVTACSVLQ